jgi:hypothetical protein
MQLHASGNKSKHKQPGPTTEPNLLVEISVYLDLLINEAGFHSDALVQAEHLLALILHILKQAIPLHRLRISQELAKLKHGRFALSGHCTP